MGLRERLGIGATGLRVGTHKYDGKGDFQGHRFHLRVDSKKTGVLMVDASKLIFLNGTGLEYTHGILEGWDDRTIIKNMKSRYRGLDDSTASEHLSRVRSQLTAFLTGSADAIRQVVSDTSTIGADALPSPYRMDLALTYRCQNECRHCYNEARNVRELNPDEWLAVLDLLWKIGIPHIVFTGGEPTLCSHLPRLITRSEELGQITGLITNGRKLGEERYLSNLIQEGLDHVQITLLSHRASVHDSLTRSPGSWNETVQGMKVGVSEDIYLSTNTTIMEENAGDVEDTVRFLIGLGVKDIALNGLIRSGKGKSARGISYEELDRILLNVTSITEDAGVKLVWYTPTPYCEFNPINYGLGIKQCTACSLNMAIEPNGDVLPCQSYYEPLGNILKDTWEGIWNHRLCGSLRAREYLSDECARCKLADVCGGGCPLSHRQEDYMCLDRHSSI